MFETTTPIGVEGTNISYSDEKRSAEELLKSLSPKWKVKFEWAQILFSDVQYRIDNKKKLVEVVYNQNLRYWWPQAIEAIKEKATASKR